MHIHYAYNTIKNQYDFDAIKHSNMKNSNLENPATQTQEQPQVECYTKITNNLLDALMQADITLHQHKVLLAILRKTFGFHKKTDRITDSQLGKLTNLLRHKVNKAKNELIALSIIVKQGNEIGINPNLSKWFTSTSNKNSNALTSAQKRVIFRQNTKSVPKTGTVDNSEISPKAEIQSVPKTGTKPVPETGTHKRKKKTKENNNIYIQNFSLDLSCFKQQPTQSVWLDYLLHRKAKKAPLTQTALNRLASKINEANEKGYDTNDVLADCMLRNWQSFDVAWLENKRVVTSPAMQSKQELEAAWNDTKVVEDFIKSPAFAEALRVGELRRNMYS